MWLKRRKERNSKYSTSLPVPAKLRKVAYVESLLEEMRAGGLVQIHSYRADGKPKWVLTDRGRQQFERELDKKIVKCVKARGTADLDEIVAYIDQEPPSNDK